MTLRNTDVSTVESDMKEEVQYLYTANSDDTIPEMDTQSSEYNGKMWNYFSYNMEELSGYRVWVELSDVMCLHVQLSGLEKRRRRMILIRSLRHCLPVLPTMMYRFFLKRNVLNLILVSIVEQML